VNVWFWESCPESQTPVVLEVVCFVVDVCVHLTLQPRAIVTEAGVKLKFAMLTATGWKQVLAEKLLVGVLVVELKRPKALPMASVETAAARTSARSTARRRRRGSRGRSWGFIALSVGTSLAPLARAG
jgi:hypothetical protein